MIDTELSVQLPSSFDYKELRDIVIMERYFEKQKREIMNPASSAEHRTIFRKKFNIKPECLAAELNSLILK
jgi:hypothetical protein